MEGEMAKFCCESFAEQAGHLQAPAGGGSIYPIEMRPTAQFEPDKNGSWNINGCCGGGCYVVTEMKFCPFCGTRVTIDAMSSA
jgi:hypothetical protein